MGNNRRLVGSSLASSSEVVSPNRNCLPLQFRADVHVNKFTKHRSIDLLFHVNFALEAVISQSNQTDF